MGNELAKALGHLSVNEMQSFTRAILKAYGRTPIGGPVSRGVGGGCKPTGGNGPRKQRNREVEVPVSAMSRAFGCAPGRPINTKPCDYAPKRRFQIGTFMRFSRNELGFDPGDSLWEIVYCYRMVANPSEWIYGIEERKGMRSVDPNDKIGQVFKALGLGEGNPRIAEGFLFFSEMDVFQYFWDIPKNGTGVHLPNQKMMKGVVVSSGEVVDPQRKSLPSD